MRESLVTILEHRDEAQGTKDTTKALILKAKQMKLRYCAISVYKNNSKKRPDPNFFDFPSEKNLRKYGAPFVGELTRSFSLPPTHTYVLDTKDIVRTLCAIKKVVNEAFPKIFKAQEIRSGPSEREKE